MGIPEHRSYRRAKNTIRAHMEAPLSLWFCTRKRKSSKRALKQFFIVGMNNSKISCSNLGPRVVRWGFWWRSAVIREVAAELRREGLEVSVVVVPPRGPNLKTSQLAGTVEGGTDEDGDAR